MLDELINEWKSFIGKSKQEDEYDEADHQHYKKLLVDSFKIIINEWSDETISKDLCRLLITMASLEDFIDYSDDYRPIFHRSELYGYFDNDEALHHWLMKALVDNTLKFSDSSKLYLDVVVHGETIKLTIDTDNFDVDYDQLAV